MHDDPFRSQDDDVLHAWPRWPAIRGATAAIHIAFSRSGIAAAWWWLKVAVAFALMPLSLALHGLRRLGGANPERRDAAKLAAAAFDMDLSAQPLSLILAILSPLATFIIVGSAIGFIK